MCGRLSGGVLLYIRQLIPSCPFSHTGYSRGLIVSLIKLLCPIVQSFPNQYLPGHNLRKIPENLDLLLAFGKHMSQIYIGNIPKNLWNLPEVPIHQLKRL